MKLHDCIGVWFSQLNCTRAERWFCYDFSMHGDHRKEGNYRYYGDLQDGTRCGAFVFPSMTSWADFKDPPFTGIVLVDGKGKMKTLTPAERMHQLPEEHYFPIAIVPSPTGKSLAWITEGDLWTWCMDSREGRFIGDDGTMETRFGDRKVSDACMHEDGILEVLLEDGSTLGLFCDEEMILQPFEDGWVPGDDAAVWNLLEHPRCWTDSLRLMIRKADEGWEYYDRCVRRVCFEPGLEVIKAGILGMNQLLDTVVIPESVRQVETFAFGCCDNLKNLVIKGDLSRIAGWAEDAFDGCACEAYYKQLRDKYL